MPLAEYNVEKKSVQVIESYFKSIKNKSSNVHAKET